MLGLLVVVVERRSDLEIVLAERAGIAAADVARAEVVKASKIRAPRNRVEHVAGAVDVDPDCQLSLDRQVVDGGEMPNLGDVVQEVGFEAEPALRDVSFDQPDASAQVRAELLDPLRGQLVVVRLHQADRIFAGAAHDAGQQRAAEKAGKSSHQYGHKAISLRRSFYARIGLSSGR